MDSQATAPYLRLEPDVTLVLPPAYADALHAYDPAFRPWDRSAFPSWILDTPAFAPTRRQAPFAVVGDLNGDGLADVVIMGHGADYEANVAVLTQPDGLFVAPHRRVSLSDRASRYRGDLGEAMVLVTPGRYESSWEGPPLELATDAFEWVHLEKAATIVYWLDGRFREWISSD